MLSRKWSTPAREDRPYVQLEAPLVSHFGSLRHDDRRRGERRPKARSWRVVAALLAVAAAVGAQRLLLGQWLSLTVVLLFLGATLVAALLWRAGHVDGPVQLVQRGPAMIDNVQLRLLLGHHRLPGRALGDGRWRERDAI
jgi:hypothetical protein